MNVSLSHLCCLSLYLLTGGQAFTVHFVINEFSSSLRRGISIATGEVMLLQVSIGDCYCVFLGARGTAGYTLAGEGVCVSAE